MEFSSNLQKSISTTTTSTPTLFPLFPFNVKAQIIHSFQLLRIHSIFRGILAMAKINFFLMLLATLAVAQNLTGEPECAVIMLSIPSTPIVAKVIRLNVFALPSKLRLVTPMIKVVNALWKEKHPSSLCQHNVS